MKYMNLLITGATGLQGAFFLERLSETLTIPQQINCLVRSTSNVSLIPKSNLLSFNYFEGDSSIKQTWDRIFEQKSFDTIIHIASIRHVPVIIESLVEYKQTPRLIVIGTTGVYSQYNDYSSVYKQIEKQLESYQGHFCLLRPTMIYGSDRDQNLHKLIKFCHHYGFFFVFGEGKTLLQPVHADDLAQAILSVLQNPNIKGVYDLSGGTVVNFIQLIDIIEELLGKPVKKLRFPFQLGILLATIAEKILGKKSPIRKEQILRLQEDKAYSHESAKIDFGYSPRSLKDGLKQEIEIMTMKNII